MTSTLMMWAVPCWPCSQCPRSKAGPSEYSNFSFRFLIFPIICFSIILAVDASERRPVLFTKQCLALNWKSAAQIYIPNILSTTPLSSARCDLKLFRPNFHFSLILPANEIRCPLCLVKLEVAGRGCGSVCVCVSAEYALFSGLVFSFTRVWRDLRPMNNSDAVCNAIGRICLLFFLCSLISPLSFRLALICELICASNKSPNVILVILTPVLSAIESRLGRNFFPTACKPLC